MQAKWINCEQSLSFPSVFLAFLRASVELNRVASGEMRFLELALSYRVASGEMRFLELALSYRVASSEEYRSTRLRANSPTVQTRLQLVNSPT